MAIKVKKEVNRHPGLTPDTTYMLTGEIIGGQPLVLVTATTCKPYAGGTGVIPYGLAIESTEQLATGDSETHAGSGYDYSDYARGGLVGAFMDGGIFELTDDGRGAPFETGDTYTLNKKVYAKSNGKITSDGGNATAGYNPEVGIVLGVVGSPVTKLTIKLTI